MQDSDLPSTILDLLSFEGGGGDIMTRHSHPVPMQGVLWKRRDVFRNRWRPRWFVLHQDQHILTYYLLANPDGGGPQQVSSGLLAGGGTPSSSSNPGNRLRTFSESSNVSENTVDYDVVPRGTIYLVDSTVEANESLTRPDENLYALTITDHENAVHCHLAARTLESRDQWIAQIAYASRGDNNRPSGRQRQHGRPAASPRLPTAPPVRTNGSTEPLTPPRGNLRRTGPSASRTNQNALVAVPSEDSSDSVGPREGIPSLGDPPRQQPAQEQSDEPSGSRWTVIRTERLTENIPPGLESQIEEKLAAYLPYVEEKEHPDWIFRHERNGVHCSVHAGQAMIRSILTGTRHHPVEYLQILLDMPRSMEYETNVRTQSLLRTYNSNTSLVYKAYHPVWPTSARDFATATFWCLLERGDRNERALCLLAFSCDEANELKPPEPRHVRGTLNVVMNFFRVIDGGGCFHSRIISYNLNGTIPKKMMQSILEQQASMPRVMDLYLSNYKNRSPEALPTFGNDMDYETVYEALKSVDEVNALPMPRKQDYDRSESLVTSQKRPSKHVTLKPPTVEREILVLLTPVVLYNLLSALSRGLGATIFLASSILAIRWVALQHFLTIFRLSPVRAHNKQESVAGVGTTSCRFNVDLKGVLRFLSNEKEAKTQLGSDGAEILVSHIVVRSLAKAMADLPREMISRTYPLLPSVYSIDVMIHDQKSRGPVWVPDVDEMNVQEIADFLAAKATTPASGGIPHFFGPTCRLWTTPDSVHSQVDVDVNAVDCYIAVCISCIRLEKDKKTPALSVSINIQSTNVDACRSFSEQVQRLVQFPEMCDDS